MAPKAKKEATPSVQAEDLTQDVLLVVSVPACHLQMGLQADGIDAAQALADPAAVPELYLEVHHSPSATPILSAAAHVGPGFILPCGITHVFRYLKGPDIIDRLINTTLELRLCNNSSRAVLATARVDLLPFGLSSNNHITDGALPWQPAAVQDTIKVMLGSTVAFSCELKHQPRPSTACAVPVPAPGGSVSSAGGSGAAANAAAAAANAAAAAESAAAAAQAALLASLEPLSLLSPEQAAGCNVVHFTALSAAPLPPAWGAAAHAAAGNLTCSLQLQLPTPAGQPALRLKCAGGVSNGARLEWSPQQQPCRLHLTTTAVAALKSHLELGQPLLLEAARYLSGPAADTACDPAFSTYHALLQFDGAAEELQEMDAVSVAGCAVPMGCMSWALQQGKVATAGLPPAPTPSSSRAKPIEDAPPAPTEGQTAPVCMWAAAGTRFSVCIRLARPLWDPWQPPAPPSKHLTDLIPARPSHPRAPPPTAAERFRAKVREVAADLAEQYVQQVEGKSKPGALGTSHSKVQQQQQLVYDLNCSGKYLAIKQQLRPLLVGLVHEQHSTSPALSHSSTAADMQQLHHELYDTLRQELRQALCEAATQQQVQQSHLQQQAAQQALTERPEELEHSQCGNAAEVQRLLLLAAEQELVRDLDRADELHLKRIALQGTADAWRDYGALCLRRGDHARAHTALKEALTLDTEHTGAREALLCLHLAEALGVCGCESDLATGTPEPAASEAAEVLGHSLKDSKGSGVLPWALLALLYRHQGKEQAARSCHQELLRQSKAAWTSMTATTSRTPTSSSSSTQAEACAVAHVKPAEPTAPVTAPAAPVLLAAANGYLAAAELSLQLHLPRLAAKLLDLASGLRDPSGSLGRLLKVARAYAALQTPGGQLQEALTLLRDLADDLAAEGSDEDKGLVHLMLGDLQFQMGNFALAKQHYRRALQKCPQHFSTRTYLQLGACFMSSGDVATAADLYTSCISEATRQAAAADPAASPPPPAAASEAEATGGEVNSSGLSASRAALCGWPELAARLSSSGPVPLWCASVWMALAQAHARLGDRRSAELALSEANLCDPQHPAVWGHLALLALQQGREGDARVSLRQALRFGLGDSDLLMQIGDMYVQRGRFQSAADCLARAAAAHDTVKVRVKLAGVLLSLREYEGCRRQLAAAAQLPADAADQQMLEDVVKKLQVAWPLL